MRRHHRALSGDRRRTRRPCRAAPPGRSPASSRDVAEVVHAPWRRRSRRPPPRRARPPRLEVVARRSSSCCWRWTLPRLRCTRARLVVRRRSSAIAPAERGQGASRRRPRSMSSSAGLAVQQPPGLVARCRSRVSASRHRARRRVTVAGLRLDVGQARLDPGQQVAVVAAGRAALEQPPGLGVPAAVERGDPRACSSSARHPHHHGGRERAERLHRVAALRDRGRRVVDRPACSSRDQRSAIAPATTGARTTCRSRRRTRRGSRRGRAPRAAGRRTPRRATGSSPPWNAAWC